MALLTIAVAGCSPGTAQVAQRTPTPAAGESRTASASPSPSAGSNVDAILAGMSVEEKVGQLFMPVLYGSRADSAHGENQARYGVATPAKMIEKYRPGGVILFPWAGNVSDVKQVAGLTTGLRKASPKIPLVIGVDQENGVVSRLAPLVTPLPGAMAIGATGDTGNARKSARVTGEELRALGISLDFAPVADVNVNPANPVIGSRSYGSNPAKVAAMVAAAVDGFHAGGVAATAKHFPGHGDTTVDSHTGLPVIRHSRSQWEKLDAPPFRAAIAHGVDAIMSAHIVMPKLDSSGNPATLSHKILTGLLREKLGFKGVIVTDALDMAGVRKRYGDAEVAVRAVLAGADVLLMPPDFPKAYNAVLKAVRSGRIPAARLDASVTRILRLKMSRGLFEPTPVDPGAVRSHEHLKVARKIAAQAVTLVRSPPLPLRGSVLVTGPAGERLSALLDGATAVKTAETPKAGEISAAERAARRADVVVVTTQDADPMQTKLVGAMVKTRRPVIVVSMGAPYELARLGAYAGALAVYSATDSSLEAAAAVLTGAGRAGGRIPVALNLS